MAGSRQWVTVFLVVALGTPAYRGSRPAAVVSARPPAGPGDVSVLISSEALLVGLSELQIALERESEVLTLPP